MVSRNSQIYRFFMYTTCPINYAPPTIVVYLTIDPRIPAYNAGTEHAGLSPTRRTPLAFATKREAKRDVFGESREWVSCILPSEEPLVRPSSV